MQPQVTPKVDMEPGSFVVVVFKWLRVLPANGGAE